MVREKVAAPVKEDHAEEAYLIASTDISRLEPLMITELIAVDIGSELCGVKLITKLSAVSPTLL